VPEGFPLTLSSRATFYSGGCSSHPDINAIRLTRQASAWFYITSRPLSLLRGLSAKQLTCCEYTRRHSWLSSYAGIEAFEPLISLL
jgi:hypothetical protein